jgi:hypothetical protein
MSATTELQGIVLDLPDAEYRQAPGLSSTGIKHLLDSPARYQWEQTHRTDKRAFDLGHAVHQRVLGVGPELVVIPAEDLASNGAATTKAAKDFITAARAAGHVPLKQAEFDQIESAAAAVTNHPDAGPLLFGGEPEVSVFWDNGGVPCKGRLDYWHESAGLVVDLKTSARSIHPRRIARLAADLGWHIQAGHYRTGVEFATGTAPRFLHVAVEIEPPHQVVVVELDEVFLDTGSSDALTAVDIYRRCAEANDWPAYPAGIHRITRPRWLAAAEDLEIA